jgi:hypothetical protein
MHAMGRRRVLLPVTMVVVAVTLVGLTGCGSNDTATTAPPAPAPSSSSASPPASGGTGTSGTAGPSGTTGTSGPTGTAVTPGSAPCTHDAILDGVTAQDPTVSTLTDFRCDGQWAYAHGYTSTFLLEANGPNWEAVDTLTNCPSAAIPDDIKAVAC